MLIDSIIGLLQIHKRPEYIFPILRDTFHTPSLQQTLGPCIHYPTYTHIAPTLLHIQFGPYLF